MISMERIEDLDSGLSYFRPADVNINQHDDTSLEKLCDWCSKIEWTWDSKNEDDFVNLANHNRDVKFHTFCSRGTAIVRGSLPMSKDQFYWEVKLTQPVYGTDVMIGVGTSEADMSQVHHKFLSILGMDDKTWGLSYTGLFHHCGEAQDYAPRFRQGNVIGVHLDLWRGTLSFYKDKKHLGIASSGLKGKTLYAMASSTAARSGMRITRCSSFSSSLQFLCCLRLRDIIPDDKNVLDVIDIPLGLRHFLDTNLDWLFDQRDLEQTADNLCKHGNLKYNHLKETTKEKCNAFVVPFFPSSSDAAGNDAYWQPDVIFNSIPCAVRNYNRVQTSRRRFLDLDENDEPEEKAAKRLHYSFNYSLGLSDTDSDCD